MGEDLKVIKKKYGEKMMQLCRELFPTIIDNNPGILANILLDSFEPSRDLYEDIVKRRLEIMFKNYIFSIYEQLTCVKERPNTFVEDPKTLMRKVGYTLYECESESDIQKFKKYYAPGEMLCTFTQGGRLRNCFVYFAVKDGADELKRSNFVSPKRQDEYGTSVISIQFTRDRSHTISIKNRYNHTVQNPDATFSNNLDNIIMGLSQSFADYYGMIPNYLTSRNFELPGYVRASDGKYYKYYYEINNVYYCPNNVIVDNFKVFSYPREKYLVMDYFVLDLVNKKIVTKVDDAFVSSIGEIKSINIINDGDGKKVNITPVVGETIVIVLDKFQRIVSLKNNNVKKIGDNFLKHNEVINSVSLNSVQSIGNYFLFNSEKIKEIELDNVQIIGNNFIFKGHLKNIYLPKVKVIGNNFMWENMEMKEIILPEVKKIGNDFMASNFGIEKISMPKVLEIGGSFLVSSRGLNEIFFPNVRKVGERFCFHGKDIKEISMPKVLEIGDYFLTYNQGVLKVDFPDVKKIGNSFMRWNQSVKELRLMRLEEIGNDALINNRDLENVVISETANFNNNINLKVLLNNNVEKKLILAI